MRCSTASLEETYRRPSAALLSETEAATDEIKFNYRSYSRSSSVTTVYIWLRLPLYMASFKKLTLPAVFFSLLTKGRGHFAALKLYNLKI